MPLEISFQPIGVLIDGQDTEGNLILADGQLAAVIIRLDSETHPPQIRGSWRLVLGLSKCNVHGPPLFRTAEEAGTWVEQLFRGSAS